MTLHKIVYFASGFMYHVSFSYEEWRQWTRDQGLGDRAPQQTPNINELIMLHHFRLRDRMEPIQMEQSLTLPDSIAACEELDMDEMVLDFSTFEAGNID